MAEMAIYGYGDDLIEVARKTAKDTGPIYTNFDLTGINQDDIFVAVSDGTLVKFHFTQEGQWKLNVLFRGEQFVDAREIGDPMIDTEATCEYSDVLYIRHRPAWVVVTEHFEFVGMGF